MTHKKAREFRVMNRGLVDVPIKNTSKRARNWCATITPDPNSPGGMTRKFWQSGRGDLFHYIVPETLDLLAVIEFGADQMSWNGANRTPERYYAVVIGYLPSKLTLYECESPLAAFTLADDLKAQREEARIKAQQPPAPSVEQPATTTPPANDVDAD